jgi:pyruvate formate lyase activating enzyme
MNDLHEARYWRLLDSNKVECLLCPAGCKLSDQQTGICFGRQHINCKLYAINYGEVVSMALDPIEKKPLYHFYPGSQILSVGPNGCNLRCDNCQNWQISQEHQPTRPVSPEQLVRAAQDADSIGVAYTYSEPLIWFEYIHDAAVILCELGLKTVLVTNGYINEEPFRELAPVIDAMNIDVKSLNPDFYRDVCKGSLADVLRTVEIAVSSGILVEITNLVITGLNDSDADLHALVDWLARLDRKIPLHFSRYFPQHKMDRPMTPSTRLQNAYDIARAQLDYVYVGNIDLPGTSDTLCPQCGCVLITRHGYQTRIVGLANSHCAQCQRKVDIRL